jgi:hypothetical protein
MLRVEYALTTDRTMKALTGLTRSAFRALIPAFDQALWHDLPDLVHGGRDYFLYRQGVDS